MIVALETDRRRVETLDEFDRFWLGVRLFVVLQFVVSGWETGKISGLEPELESTLVPGPLRQSEVGTLAPYLAPPP